MSASEKRGTSRPTIRAIAKMAGVSRTTVSLILANRQDMISRFRAATVEKVRQAAETLGYRANLLALSLRSPHPSFFALLLRGPGRRDPDSVAWHHQAFEGMFLAGALEASRSLRLYPVVATQDLPDAQESLQATREVLDGGVFGAVVRTPLAVLRGPLQQQIERGMPVVMVFPDDSSSCRSNVIDLDNVETGRTALRLLHEAGRRRCLVLHEEHMWDALRVRLQGTKRQAQEAGCPIHELSIPAGTTADHPVTWLAARLSELKVDGIYGPSALSTLCALRGCEAAGLRVPDDVCVVGSDSAMLNAPGFPRLTSVDVSWYQAGEVGVRKMAELRDANESTFENVLLPPLVHTGESCPIAD